MRKTEVDVRKSIKKENLPAKRKKENSAIKRIVNIAKLVLMIFLVCLIFMTSNKLAEFIQKMSLTDLKIIINLIFGMTAMYLYKK